MNPNNIQADLERFVVEELLVGDRATRLDPEQSLLETGILDSLALLRLVAFLEEQYGIVVKDNEVMPENFETLNSISNYLVRKRAAD